MANEPLYCDFETRSRCNLLTRGAYNYAQDPSTAVLCFSWAFGDEEVATWRPGQPFPARVLKHIAGGGQIRAHNAQFERLIFWYVLCPDLGIPEPALEQFYCTAAEARANAFPGKLEDVGRASGSNMRKDHRGAQLIKLLSIPREDGTFLEDEALMAEMVAYCEQDVRTMRAVSKTMRQLTNDELADYHVSERINDRGILLDKPLAEAAVRYADIETREIQDLVRELTDGAITSVRSPKMRAWVMSRVGDEALRVMTVYKDGEKKFSIDKHVRANLLLLADEDPDQVPPEVADVIQCADDLWASSVAKFSKAPGLADDEDGRVRGAYQFNGAGSTHRFSSLGLQLHNYPRKCAKNSQDVRDAMVRGEPIVPTYGARATDVLKSMLRPSLVPKRGHVFIVADWAGIEARGLPWLSGSEEAEPRLQAFREGADVYIPTAAAIFGCSVETVAEDHENGGTMRQIGKVTELSAGYAGGIGAFHAMSRNYGIKVGDDVATRAIKAWRRENGWAVTFWAAAESAMLYALRHPGTEFAAGRMSYLYDGESLWAALPSGRILRYPFCKRDGDDILYLKAAWKPSADAKEWPRARLWKGILVENGTQAICASILKWALAECEKEGIPVAGHTHDEIIAEVPKRDADEAKLVLDDIMREGPAWAAGMPLDVESKIMERYGK